MQQNYLTKWLEDRSDEHISSVSTESEYYSIRGMKFRVSDHLTNKIDHDIDVVFLSPRKYIIIPTNAKFRQPTLCTNWKDGVEFLEGWMRFVIPYLSNPTKNTTLASCMDDIDIAAQTAIENSKKEDALAAQTNNMLNYIHDTSLGVDDVAVANDMNGADDLLRSITTDLDDSWFSNIDAQHAEKRDKLIADMLPYFNGDMNQVKKFCHYANTMSGTGIKSKLEWLERLLACCKSRETHNKPYRDIVNGSTTRFVLDNCGSNWLPSTKAQLMADIIHTIDKLIMKREDLDVEDLLKKMGKVTQRKSDLKLVWLKQQLNGK